MKEKVTFLSYFNLQKIYVASYSWLSLWIGLVSWDVGQGILVEEVLEVCVVMVVIDVKLVVLDWFAMSLVQRDLVVLVL